MFVLSKKLIMEKLEVREAVARYVKQFEEESQKLQQQMSDVGPVSETSYVSLIKPTSLAINLLELQNLECHTDVCINCTDGSFFVHSGILMSASPLILNHFIKTNQPENFDPQGRRHLDMKSFTVSETASILFLFYSGSSMHHDLEEIPAPSAEEVSEAKQKVLLKILARFGTKSTDLVMSIPLSGSASSTASSKPFLLRFSRKSQLKATREDFFISLTGQITTAPPIVPNELLTAPGAAEDCSFCPVVCTPTSSRKVHLENCRYANASRKGVEELAAFKKNYTSIFNIEPILNTKPPDQIPVPVPTPTPVFIPVIPTPTAVSVPVSNSTPILPARHNRTPPRREEAPEQKKKHHVSRKEEHYTDIRRTFEDCKEKSMKRSRVSVPVDVEQVYEDQQAKPSKSNKENYRPCKETSSDSEESEEPELRRHKIKKKRVSQWINKTVGPRTTPSQEDKYSGYVQKVGSQFPKAVKKSVNIPSQPSVTKDMLMVKQEICSWIGSKPARVARKSTG